MYLGQTTEKDYLLNTKFENESSRVVSIWKFKTFRTPCSGTFIFLSTFTWTVLSHRLSLIIRHRFLFLNPIQVFSVAELAIIRNVHIAAHVVAWEDQFCAILQPTFVRPAAFPVLHLLMTVEKQSKETRTLSRQTNSKSSSCQASDSAYRSVLLCILKLVSFCTLWQAQNIKDFFSILQSRCIESGPDNHSLSTDSYIKTRADRDILLSSFEMLCTQNCINVQVKNHPVSLELELWLLLAVWRCENVFSTCSGESSISV